MRFDWLQGRISDALFLSRVFPQFLCRLTKPCQVHIVPNILMRPCLPGRHCAGLCASLVGGGERSRLRANCASWDKHYIVVVVHLDSEAADYSQVQRFDSV